MEAVMDKRFDTEAMMDRVGEIAQEIRQSDAYPAIIGGIAGGIAGALMAALIASRISSRPKAPNGSSSTARESRNSLPMRDLVQLLAVAAGLVKQAREWYHREKERK
jgi:hypothetical protein